MTDTSDELDRMTRSRNELSGVVEEQRRELRDLRADLAASRSLLEAQVGISGRAQEWATELSTQLTDLRRRYEEMKRTAHTLAYGGESDEILDAINDLEEVVPDHLLDVEGPEAIVRGAIDRIKSLDRIVSSLGEQKTNLDGRRDAAVADLIVERQRAGQLERQLVDQQRRHEAEMARQKAALEAHAAKVGRELIRDLGDARRERDTALARVDELDGAVRLLAMHHSVKMELGAEAVVRHAICEFESVGAQARRRPEGVDPFVLELDAYRSAMADLYRHVFALPEHVVVMRTGEAARQSTAIRERFDELVKEKGTALDDRDFMRRLFQEVYEAALNDGEEPRRGWIREAWLARAERIRSEIDKAKRGKDGDRDGWILDQVLSPEALRAIRAVLRLKD